MPKLTEYELEIQENIKKNQELLKSLGIFQLGRSAKGNDKNTSNKKETKVLKRKVSEENSAPEPKPETRKKPRKKQFSVTYENYDEDDDYSSSDTESYAPKTPDRPVPTRRSTRLSNIDNKSEINVNGKQRRENRAKRVAMSNSSDPIDLLADMESPQQSTKIILKLRHEDRRQRLSLPNPPLKPSSGTIRAVSSSSSHFSRVGRSLSDGDRSKQNGAANMKLKPEPERDEDGFLIFSDALDFRPNLSPKEMLEMGSFGGTAFKRHFSTVTQTYLPTTDYTDLPFSWYSHLSISDLLTSSVRNAEVNRYEVNAGQTLEQWETSGWITEYDPRGWFQWYCRFYLGRRLGNEEDGSVGEDERQIRRWLAFCGPNGRFKHSLIKKIAANGGNVDNESIAPVVRQTLQHWGYKLTQKEYESYFDE